MGAFYEIPDTKILETLQNSLLILQQQLEFPSFSPHLLKNWIFMAWLIIDLVFCNGKNPCLHSGSVSGLADELAKQESCVIAESDPWKCEDLFLHKSGQRHF